MELGDFGIWWSGWQEGDPIEDFAGELEELGYGAIWLSGGFKPGLSSRFERLLAGTAHTTVASGIINTWFTPAAELAEAVTRARRTFPRPLPARARRQPRAPHRGLRAELRAAVLPDGGFSRRARCSVADRTEGAPDSGGARPQDACRRREPVPWRPPVLRDGRAHDLRPGRSRNRPIAGAGGGSRAERRAFRRPGAGSRRTWRAT